MKKILVSSILLATIAAPSMAKEMSGKDIAFDRKLGNCLACHMIPGGNLSGNIAPPLIAMKSRFPDKAKLRAQIWDATVANPNTIMPPFGKHQIVSEEQLDKMVDFIHTL
jgi:sulfur-oxidizing protein SoxX